MSSPSLQLDVENALKAFLLSLAIFDGDLDLHSAQARELAATGDLLGLIAAPPDWEQLIVNAVVNVTFEMMTAGMQDHAKAAALAVTHAARVGALVEVFSQQNFTLALAAINAEGATWRGIGFTGWEAQPAGDSGPSPDGTQLVTQLPYVFEVFLES